MHCVRKPFKAKFWNFYKLQWGYQVVEPKPLQEIVEEVYSTYELNNFFYEEDAYEKNIEKISDTDKKLFIDE